MCPRCESTLHAPWEMSSAWTCPVHGEVAPMQAARQPGAESMRWLAEHSRVPVWLPWPLPDRWLVTGFAEAGDERTGAVATVVALSGPAPLGGVGELLIVAEEPGTGLGARLSGLAGPDAGPLADRHPHARIHAAGRPTALWRVDSPDDRAAFVGEGLGHWLWMLTWPDTAGLVVHDHLTLVDVRDLDHPLDVPFGALTPLLGS